jgi:hypothetical protein
MKHHSFPYTGKVLLAAVLCLFFFSFDSAARKIYPAKGADNGIYIDGTSYSYAPGDTMVLRASQSPYAYFHLNRFNGTSSARLVIINEGGQVTVQQHINLSNCTWIKLTGSGSGDQYGIKVESFPQAGAAVGIVQRSANIEVERLFINNKIYGFWVKEEGSCDPALQLGSWVIDNISLHDNKITNMSQEGMYLGSTAPNGERPVTCNGVTTYPKPIRLGNFKIYNNIIERTSRGGIQLCGASTGISEIYNNTITNIGYEFNYAQGNGIVLGTYTRAYVHDNNVKNTFSAGIYSLGTGTVRIENNRVENSGNLEGHISTGMSNIMVDTRETIPTEFTTFTIKNNIIGTNTDVVDVRIYATFPTFNTNNEICNNTRITGGPVTIHAATGVQWSNCNSANQLPVVNAGPAQTIALPLNFVQLSGSATDADGLITAYRWSQVSGPSPAVFSNSSIPNPVASSLVAGTYVLRLTATDNSGASVNSDVQITVRPQPDASAYVLIPARIEGENWGLMNGVQAGPTTDAGGGQQVNSVDYYDWMEYYINIPTAGTYTLNIRITSANPGGGIEITRPDGTVITNVSIPQTGWNVFQTVTASITLPAGQQAIRLVCKGTSSWNLNWFEITQDGTAPAPAPAPAPSVTYQALPGKVEAENYVAMSGVQKENTSDAGSGQNVGYIDQNDWMDYNVNPSTAGTYTVAVRVASQMTGGQLQIRNASGTVLATMNLPNTGGWQTWQTVTASLTLPSGNQTLRVVSTSASSWNINWIEFTAGATQPAPTPSYLALPGKVEAEAYVAMSGVQKEGTSDTGGGENVGYTDPSDWMDYNVNPSTAGTYTAAFRVASQVSGAQFQLRNSSGTILATVDVPNTGGWQSWQTVTASVTLPAGNQTLRIHITALHSNINWMEFSQGTAAPAPPPATTSSRIEAESYTAMSGVQKESTSDAGGGQNVGWIDQNDWMDYSVTAASAGAHTFSFRVASQMTGGQLQVRNASGTVLATVNLPNTGGWQTWQTVTASVTLSAGTQTLRVISSASASWNINWIEITAGATTTPTTTTVAPLRIEAENYTTMRGVQKENTSDAGGGQNVGWIDNGDWMDYSVNVPATGAYTVSFRVASQMSGAQLQLRASNGSILATVNVPNTGGWQSWQTVTASVSLSAGAQTLRIHSSSSASWNINWWELASGGASVRVAELAAETVETTAETASLSLYPNPVTDRVVVSLTNPYQGALRVEVLSLQGVVVKSFSLQKTAEGTQQFYLSVGELTTGTYILKTTMAEDTKTTQLIKQ